MHFSDVSASLLVACLTFALASPGSAATPEEDKKWVQEQGIPPEVRGKLDAKYQILFDLNPYYLRGDFNGDGKADLALRIKEAATAKVGIAIFHAGGKEPVIFGAGKAFGNGGDNFDYLDVWYVYPKQKVGQGAGDEKPPALTGEALYVEKTESASALIYWTGKGYKWYQQGD